MRPLSRLPITSILPTLKNTFATHNNVVLSALPGAGKTTQVPLALLNEPWMHDRRMIMLEPRRLAARSAASYMASTLGEAVGQTVGYRTRMDTRVSPTTRIEVVTEGILNRLLQKDPALLSYNLVIFDEYHERSLHADLGVALCLQTQDVLREDLRILIMSATLDCEAISKLLKHTPIITCEGKVFPIETHYVPQSRDAKLERSVVTCIKQTLGKEPGNFLVFLPGAGEIRRVQRLLEQANLGANVIVAPLYGNLSQEAQEQAIQPSPPGSRKIVLATSIAETSLTIEGIRVVIDSGLMRVPRFNPGSGMTRLTTVRASQDSTDQRRGRAGRLEPGSCYRLWNANEQKALLERTSPEMTKADLTPLALELAVWGITNPSSLAWLDPPPTSAMVQAQNLLTQLGALNEHHRITAHGQHMSELPLHPRLAHMVLRAHEWELGGLACDIAAILNERDFMKTHSSDRNADLRIRVDRLHSPGTGQGTKDIDRAIYQRIVKTTEQLRTLVHIPKKMPARDLPSTAVGLLLALAYPDRLAQRQSGQHGFYRLSNGKSATFFPSQPLATEEYLVVAEVDEAKPHAHIFLAAPLVLEELEDHCSELFKNVDIVEWDSRNAVVLTRQQRRLGELVIADSPLPDTPSSLVTTTLIQGIKQAGLDCLPWTKELRNWQARIEYVRRIAGKDSDWPDVSEHHLLESLESWLSPYLHGMARLSEVKRMKLNTPLHALLTWKQQETLEQQAPTHLTVPTGSRIALDYISQEIPILAVRLQELFGQPDTPTLDHAKGRVMLHLLSPARRPIQVTQDLASFWKNGYPEVKKELKGRYPKHYWPDDPLQAQPTRRTKANL